MRIGYLVNQYPKVSHSFIRREILALEAQGVEIVRVSIRGWDDVLVDAQDRAEQARTRYLLRDGAAPLLRHGLLAALRTPKAFVQALGCALRQWRRGDRSLALNLISLLEAAYLKHLFENRDVQHFHVHFGTNGAAVAMLCRKLGGPTYSLTVHGPEEFDAPRQLGLDVKVAGAAFAIAISHFAAGQLRRWVQPADRRRIHIVRCGLDATFLSREPQAPPDNRRLVCVGRLCMPKAQTELVEAIGDLHDDGIDVELVLAGDGEDRPEIERLIERRGLQQKIQITGWLSADQVRQQIESARAMVLGSTAEGLPVVLMEALALGRPVIATYIAGIPELVAEAQAGWLVPSGDRNALITAIRECLESPVAGLRAQGMRGKALVERNHSAAIEAAKLRAMFEGAIGQRVAAPITGS